MQTLLDESKYWFLEALVHGDEIRAILAEGTRSTTPEDIVIGDQVVEDTYSVSPTIKGRRVEVRFSRPVACQVIDEAYTSFDESEVRDDTGVIQSLSRSAYLRFVEDHHGWFRDVVGPAAHYRLHALDRIIDVIAHDAPVVQVLERN
ncbi:MAG TPA: hypothetical protein VMT18_04185 [Planctomycetota bacterium]|nr:hypothetical protein [Planctomycetota bacterium]